MVGNSRGGRSRLSAFQGQQWLEGLVCERLTAGWRYWDLPDLEELALRDQDHSYLSCWWLRISFFLFPQTMFLQGSHSLSLLPHDTADSVQLLLHLCIKSCSPRQLAPALSWPDSPAHFTSCTPDRPHLFYKEHVLEGGIVGSIPRAGFQRITDDVQQCCKSSPRSPSDLLGDTKGSFPHKASLPQKAFRESGWGCLTALLGHSKLV